MISRARRLAVPLTGALLATGVVGAIPAASSAATGITPAVTGTAPVSAGATSAMAAAQAGPGHVAVKAAAQTPAEAAGFWSPRRLRAATRMGYLNGVSSMAWDTDGNDRYDRISSPYFNSETYDVYAVAANRWTQ